MSWIGRGEECFMVLGVAWIKRGEKGFMFFGLARIMREFGVEKRVCLLTRENQRLRMQFLSRRIRATRDPIIHAIVHWTIRDIVPDK